MGLETFSQIVKARIFVGLADGSGPLRFLGEVSKFEISVDQDKKELINSSTAGGGLAKSVTMVKSVKVAMTTHGFDTDSLAIATFGEAGDNAGATVTNEDHTAVKGGFIPLNEGIGLSSVVVKKASDSSVITASNYEVTQGGVYFNKDAAVITGSSLAVQITYTHTTSRTIEALVNSGAEYRIWLDGVNVAEEDKPITADFYKCKISPASIPMLGDDFNEMELEFDVLSDPTKTGAGISKFYKITQVEA